jgi:hypothetical protein
MKSQVIEELWQEFHTTIGPSSVEDLQLMYGCFTAGMISLLDHLVDTGCITQSKVNEIAALIEELTPPNITEMN